MPFDFNAYWDIIKNAYRNFETLFETFLVVFGCRSAAIIMNSDGIAEFLESNNIAAYPYFLGNTLVIWNKSNERYHADNVNLYRQLKEISDSEPDKEKLREIDYFHSITGKLLNYMTSVSISSETRSGKRVYLMVSFNTTGTQKINSLFQIPSSFTWTSVNENTYYVILIPQIVIERTDEEIYAALKPCVDILQYK